jgi:protein involved in polysaccharide export with SLBB domain
MLVSAVQHLFYMALEVRLTLLEENILQSCMPFVKASPTYLIRSLLLSLLLLLAASPAIAQVDLSQTDFSTMRVDDLSDEQIIDFWAAAQARGLSMSDLEAMALSRGLSYSEVLKLRMRLRELEAEQRAGSLAQRSARTGEDDDFEDGYDPDDPFFVLLESRRAFMTRSDSTLQDSSRADSTGADAEDGRKKIFGEDLFRSEDLTFAPTLNIPTPENYQVGPGDELIIDVWGANKMTYEVEVSREGNIVLENLGPIYINGLSIEEAERRIVSRLSQLYAGLSIEETSQGGTYADVSLGRVRSIRVHIIGEVMRPATYTLPSLATVINALYVSGGPNENGTYRRIQIIRGGGVHAEFDVYDFLVYGEQTGNIRLLDQDVVKVDPYLARVETEGELKRTMFFELKPGETLADLLRFAGSFTGEAYTELIHVHRTTGTERRLVDVAPNEFASVELKNGDQIFVDEVLDRFENRVFIRGAVYRQGEYELGGAQTVYGLIQKAQGLKGDALLSRAQIYRTREDMTTELIPFDLARVIQDPASSDILLRKDDVVVIPSMYELREDYFVEIDGSVQDPGRYPYMEAMTLEDLILMAQGLRSEASLLRVEVARRRTDAEVLGSDATIAETFQFAVDPQFGLQDNGAEFVLQPFDQVFIRRSPGYVEQINVYVAGEVLYPGTYAIETKEDRVSDLIRRAGGLTPEAYPRGASLVRKNPEPGAIGINLESILAEPGSMDDLLILNGDSIYIPPRLQTVRVSGAVFQPTLVRYVPGLTLKDYISRAGGTTNVADYKRAYVIYPNGSADRLRDRFLFFDHYPRIEPGAEIVVPTRPEGMRMSAQERILIASSIVSLAAVIATTISQFR